MATARREIHSDIAVSATCGCASSRSLRRSALAWVTGSCWRSAARSTSSLSSARRTSWSGSRRMSASHLSASVWILRATRSLTAVGTHVGARWVMSDSKRSSLSTSQARISSSDEVDEADVGLVAHHLVEQPAGHGAHRLLDEAWQHGLLDDGAHVLVGDAVQGVHRDRGDLVDEPLGVTGHEGPLGGPPGRLGVEDPLADDLLAHEVLADELLEAAPDHLLLARDERGVRDRQAQRVAEDAVTANQSAQAPTIEASAPALTKPSTPSSWPRVST